MADEKHARCRVRIEPDARLVVVHGQGLWSSEIAADCGLKVRGALREVQGQTWKVLLDFTTLLPQRPEVQDALKDLFRNVKAGTPGAIAVSASNAVTMLQLKRLWAESGAGECKFCPSLDIARRALSV